MLATNMFDVRLSDLKLQMRVRRADAVLALTHTSSVSFTAVDATGFTFYSGAVIAAKPLQRCPRLLMIHICKLGCGVGVSATTAQRLADKLDVQCRVVATDGEAEAVALPDTISTQITYANRSTARRINIGRTLEVCAEFFVV